MLTYNDIYECLRKERYSEQLQLLPKKFIAEVSDYIKEKKKLANQQDDTSSEDLIKIKKQIENSTSIFNELILLRKKKLLGLAFVASETGISKRDFENMLDFEKELFDKIIAGVQEADKKVSYIFNNGFENKEIQGEGLKLILFLEDIEEFVGLNGEAFGPYKKDEIVNISKTIADILISGKKAEVVSED